MTDAASFDAIMQCNLLELFCEALGASIFVTDTLDQITFASVKLLHFFPMRETAIEPGGRARDLYGALFDAGCRFGSGGERYHGRNREEWIAERVASAWKERVDTVERIGPDRWLRIVSRRFSSGLGFTVMQDVSELKRKENQLRAEQERVKLTEEILDTLPVAIAVKDRNLNFAAVNAEFCRIVKIVPDAILGRSVWDVVEPELANRMEEADRRLLATGEDRQTVISLNHVEGGALDIFHRAKRVGRPGRHYLSMSFVELENLSQTIDVPEVNRPVPATAPAAQEEVEKTAASDADQPAVAAMFKVLLLVGKEHDGTAVSLALAARNIELCLISDEKEFAAFIPAAKEAGVVIDLVLIDGDFPSSACDVTAKAGLKFRPIPAGPDDATVLAEIVRALEGTPFGRAKPVANTTLMPSQHTPPTDTAKPASSTKRTDILAVEDNVINLLALEQILESMGMDFALATSGQEAITLAQTLSPRMILADLTLPDMEIDELARRFGRQGERMPVIGLVPIDSYDNRQKCIAAGLDDYLAKPLSPDTLDVIIRKYLIETPDMPAAVAKSAA